MTLSKLALAIAAGLLVGGGAARSQSVLYAVAGGTSADIGFVVAAVGDVDGDRIADFATSDANNNGSIDIWSGQSGHLVHQFTTPAAFIGFGAAICGGDVNGDGVPDILIGAPTAAPGFGGDERGSAFVYSGSDFSLIRSHIGQPKEKLGWSVVVVGDVNGDGVGDYAIGSPNTGFLGSKIGKVTIFSGATGSVLHTMSAQVPASNFGESLVALGDVTGDCIPDVAIGETTLSSGGFTANGAVRLYSGATGLLVSSIFGTNDFAEVGRAMAPLGDVNQDGKNDLVVTAFDLSNSVDGALVCSPATSSVISQTFGDIQVSLPFGATVGEIADVDGDGASDVLLVDRSRSVGQVIIANSRTGERRYIVPPVLPSSIFPSQLHGLGDVNGDGYPEFVVGDPGSSPGGGQSTGAGWVFTTRPLHATPQVLSASAPSPIKLALSPGVGHAGSVYLVLASVSPEGGGCGGFNVGPASVHVPFCFDAFMGVSIAFANSSIFQTTFGSTDAYTGAATATLDASGTTLPPSAIGIGLQFFFLTKAAGVGGWDKAWQAETVFIGP